MIKVFFNKTIETVPHVPVLYPNIGSGVMRKTVFIDKISVHYKDPVLQVVENPADAEFILLPHNFFKLKKHKDFISEYVKLSRESGKPIIVFAYGDPEDKIDIPNSIVFKSAQYRNKREKNVILMPGYVEDLFTSYCGGKEILREKRSIPTVGFSGWVDAAFRNYAKSYLKDWCLRALGMFVRRLGVRRKGIFIRQKAVKIFERSPLVRTKFIKRNSYSGHIGTIDGDIEKVRREFVDNILESDYCLDVRGYANASTRFYEILSLGRIPLYIDTERVLPLENLINYREFCVFVDYQDLGRVDRILYKFHQGVSSEEFENMQKKARKVFEKYLRIDSFFKIVFLDKEALYSHIWR